jgi:hypothetical protein
MALPRLLAVSLLLLGLSSAWGLRKVSKTLLSTSSRGLQRGPLVRPLNSIFRFECDLFPQLAEHFYGDNKAAMCMSGIPINMSPQAVDWQQELIFVFFMIAVTYVTRRTLPTESYDSDSDSSSGSESESDSSDDEDGYYHSSTSTGASASNSWGRGSTNGVNGRRKSASTNSTSSRNTCPQCNDKGVFLGETCDLCEGTGFIDTLALPGATGSRWWGTYGDNDDDSNNSNNRGKSDTNKDSKDRKGFLEDDTDDM